MSKVDMTIQEAIKEIEKVHPCIDTNKEMLTPYGIALNTLITFAQQELDRVEVSEEEIGCIIGQFLTPVNTAYKHSALVLKDISGLSHSLSAHFNKPVEDECPNCRGKGTRIYHQGDRKKVCPRCQGKGVVVAQIKGNMKIISYEKYCPECKGNKEITYDDMQGHKFTHECTTCKGTGKAKPKEEGK